MPFYDFRCIVCGETMPHYRKIADRDDPEEHCGHQMTRIISAPALRLEIPAYVSPASGKWINSRAQRREDLKREDCIEYEPGLKEHIAKVKIERQQEIFKGVEKTIDETVSSMHASNLI